MSDQWKAKPLPLPARPAGWWVRCECGCGGEIITTGNPSLANACFDSYRKQPAIRVALWGEQWAYVAYMAAVWAIYHADMGWPTPNLDAAERVCDSVRTVPR